ncbi:type II secretion system protein [Bilifractor sp. LCP19S3_H10]|uniref:type II secretion system protein n=1 Tax=Bilifractor sp. LCP19S3_H10 TaxID=3438736 RepID=UPI003F931811
MKEKQNKKGFTLAELLIVVAIIGVLVAISIPIFSKQLEKARDATSVANLRSAYSQAMSYVIEYNGNIPSNYFTPADNPNIILYGGPDYGGNITAVRIKGVYLHSSSANNWSGMANNLPFYNIIAKPNAKEQFWKDLDPYNHGDSGEYNGYYTVEFYMVKKNYDGTPSAVRIEKAKHNTPNY